MTGTTTGRMKAKSILLASALFGASAIASAQSYHVGLSLGPQLTNFQSNVGEYNSNFSYNVGITNEVKFTPHFSVGLDLLYSSVKASRDYKDSALLFDRYYVSRYNTTETYNYMGANLLMKYNIFIAPNPIVPYDRPDAKSNAILTLFGGGFFNHLAFGSPDSYTSEGYRDDYTVTLLGERSDATRHAYDNMTNDQKLYYINPTDFGIVLGAGLTFKTGSKSSFGFDFRYLHGLSNLDQGNFNLPTYGSVYLYTDPDPLKNQLRYETASVYTRVFQFNLSFKYRIFGKDPLF